MLIKEEHFNRILGTLRYCGRAKVKQTFCDFYAEIEQQTIKGLVGFMSILMFGVFFYIYCGYPKFCLFCM